MTDYTPAQMRLIDQHRDINTDYDWWDCTYEQFIEECAAFGIDISKATRGYDRKGPDGKFLRGPDGKGVRGTYTEPKVYFSLHQQGAGAYFECDSFSISELVEKGRAVMLLADDADNAHYKTAESPVLEQLRQNFERLEREFGPYMLSASMHDVLANTTYSVETRHEQIYVTANSGHCTDPDTPERALEDALEEDWPEVIEEMLRDVASALHKELESEYEDQTSDEAVWETIVANDLHTELDEDEDEDEEEAA